MTSFLAPPDIQKYCFYWGFCMPSRFLPIFSQENVGFTRQRAPLNHPRTPKDPKSAPRTPKGSFQDPWRSPGGLRGTTDDSWHFSCFIMLSRCKHHQGSPKEPPRTPRGPFKDAPGTPRTPSTPKDTQRIPKGLLRDPQGPPQDPQGPPNDFQSTYIAIYIAIYC